MRKITLPLAVLSAAAFAGLASCDWLGTGLSKVIPAIEVLNPEMAADPVDCDPAIPTRKPGSDCVIGELTCGDVIEGYSGVGNKLFGDEMYRNFFCTVERHKYDNAPEAAYRLEVPVNTRATVQLDSNCAELDVVAIAWEEDDRCPTARHAIHECEMDVSSGGGSIVMATVDKAQHYILAVDGQNGAVGNFRLTVKCEKDYR